MTEQEKFNTEIDKRVTNLETKFESFMQEMRDFKTEMRDRDNQRAADIREIRQDMKNMQISLDAKIDSMGKHVRNLSVAAIIGIATIAITVVYSIFSH